MMAPMFIITKTADLKSFCAQVGVPPYITVDTEFVRERTYYPILCLIQIATPQQSAVIDALAPDLDLKPLWDLFDNQEVLKVFHAGFQDIEIFVTQTGRVPTPLFDTQIAAEFCGFGESVAYDTLVQAFTDQSLDKSTRTTDWQKRPLTDKQITYARNDVVHLCTVYEKLKKRLESLGRMDWVRTEMAPLANPSFYRVDAAQAWRKIKGMHLKPRGLARLRELYIWREDLARARNKPKRRIVSDEVLVELAKQNPTDAKEIKELRLMGQGIASDLHGAALDCIQKANQLPESELPTLARTVAPPPGQGDRVDLLKLLLKKVCEDHKISPRLVATAPDLNLLAQDSTSPSLPCLSGWRREFFGEQALQLLRGDLGFKIQDAQVVLVPLPSIKA